MITIIGSLIGFSTAIVPEILNYIKDKNDKKHELKMLEKHLKINVTKKLTETEILDKIHDGVSSIQSSIDSNISIVDDKQNKINFSGVFNSSVRPVITYMFFILFVYIKIFQIQNIDFSNTDSNEFFEIIWDEQTKAMFSIVVSFWFGQRQIEKMKNVRF